MVNEREIFFKSFLVDIKVVTQQKIARFYLCLAEEKCLLLDIRPNFYRMSCSSLLKEDTAINEASEYFVLLCNKLEDLCTNDLRSGFAPVEYIVPFQNVSIQTERLRRITNILEYLTRFIADNSLDTITVQQLLQKLDGLVGIHEKMKKTFG